MFGVLESLSNREDRVIVECFGSLEASRGGILTTSPQLKTVDGVLHPLPAGIRIDMRSLLQPGRHMR